LVETWNQTEAAYPRDKCIHELFEEQAERTPDAIAVVQGETELTYAELNRRANRLAQRLVEEGIGPGDCVATLFELCVVLVISELGIVKAGAAYVPVDPRAPQARQAWMVKDCGARLVVAEVGDRAAGELGVPVLGIGSISDGDGVVTNAELALSSQG